MLAFGRGPGARPPRAPALAVPPAGRPDALPRPRWFCHVDDDNYVNVRALLRLLVSYPHTQDIYLGKPSLDRPIQATERVSESKVVSVASTQACAERGGGGRCPCSLGGRVWESHHVPPPAAPRPLLVCHRRGWLLHQPRAGPEDEPLGQVSECLGAQARLPQIPRSPHWGPGLTPLPSTRVPNLTCTGRVSRPSTARQPPGWSGPLPASGNPQLPENHLAGTEEGAVLGSGSGGSCQRESPSGARAGLRPVPLGMCTSFLGLEIGRASCRERVSSPV